MHRRRSEAWPRAWGIATRGLGALAVAIFVTGTVAVITARPGPDPDAASRTRVATWRTAARPTMPAATLPPQTASQPAKQLHAVPSLTTLFSASSPWNKPIPADPTLDPSSAVMVSRLAGGPIADIDAYGVPIYFAGPATPRRAVTCTQPWGTCPLAGRPVPIPDGARPSSGSDGVLVVVDTAAKRVYDLWQAIPAGDSWKASWGTVVALGGDGTGGATGAGDSQAAGVVRAAELAQGHIDHALVFSSADACRGPFRYPAIKSDGTDPGAGCLPEGARMQLDPSLDVEHLPGLTPAGRVVARALQVYGAYVRDSGAAPMALIFETRATAGAAYGLLGLGGDYAPFPGVPWDHLRVLRSWDGS